MVRRRSARRHRQMIRTRVRWLAVVLALVLGVVIWALGMAWGSALAGLGLLGFVVAAWWDVRPQGGHVHDSGLSAYGVRDPLADPIEHGP